jgi:hypothetical protein
VTTEGPPEEPEPGASPAGEGGDTQAPPQPEPRCANCDAPLGEDQAYCLECGEPTPKAPKLRRRGRTALILAGALALLGAGAGGLAFALATRGTNTTTVTSPLTVATGTAPLSSTGTAATAGTLPTDTTLTGATGTGTSTALPTSTGLTTATSPSTAPTAPPTTTATAPTTTAAPTTTGGGGSATSGDWPAGKAGWTAIVASAKSKSAAEDVKRKLNATGQPAGLLFSSNYSSLRPGYWVVFSGVFDTASEAEAQARKVQSAFPGAYPRHVAA